jgi:hypothetical protein
MRDNPESGPCCPLTNAEIVYWAPKLGVQTAHAREEPAEREDRLRAIVADCFKSARIFYRIRTLPPNWLEGSSRVDQALPKIAGRADLIRNELLALPGEFTAALRVQYANYDLALTALGALPHMLNEIAARWQKPHPGQPSLKIEGEVVALLIDGVEQFTGEKFASPRSVKRQAEREFVRLLTQRLLPRLTEAQFDTALRHWDTQRRAAVEN